MDSFGLVQVLEWLGRAPATLGRVDTGPFGEVRFLCSDGTEHSLVLVGVLKCSAYFERITRPVQVLGPRPRKRWFRPTPPRSTVDGPVPADDLSTEARHALANTTRMPVLIFEQLHDVGPASLVGGSPDPLLIVVPDMGTPMLFSQGRAATNMLPRRGELHWSYQIAGGIHSDILEAII